MCYDDDDDGDITNGDHKDILKNNTKKNNADSNHNFHTLKASRKDMGYAVASGSIAATTVSGTMILAHAAGKMRY